MFFVFVLSLKWFITCGTFIYEKPHRMNLFEMPLHFVPGCFNVADHTFSEFCIFRHHSPQTWNHWWGHFEVKIFGRSFFHEINFTKCFRENDFFLWNFEVKNIFGFVFWGQDKEVRCYCNISICHYYCEPHDLCVSDWPNVFLLYTLWNSMDKLLEIGAAKNGFHENDVAHWVWIEIWSRKSNNKIRNHLPMEQPLLGLVLLQKNKSKRYFQKQIQAQFFVNYCVS